MCPRVPIWYFNFSRFGKNERKRWILYFFFPFSFSQFNQELTYIVRRRLLLKKKGKKCLCFNFVFNAMVHSIFLCHGKPRANDDTRVQLHLTRRPHRCLKKQQQHLMAKRKLCTIIFRVFEYYLHWSYRSSQFVIVRSLSLYSHQIVLCFAFIFNTHFKSAFVFHSSSSVAGYFVVVIFFPSSLNHICDKTVLCVMFVLVFRGKKRDHSNDLSNAHKEFELRCIIVTLFLSERENFYAIASLAICKLQLMTVGKQREQLRCRFNQIYS